MFVGQSKTVTSLCFSSSDNVTLVSGSMDGSVRTRCGMNAPTRQNNHDNIDTVFDIVILMVALDR